MTNIDIITEHVIDKLGGIENIIDVEENCGSIWITLSDDSVKYIVIEDCEPLENI